MNLEQEAKIRKVKAVVQEQKRLDNAYVEGHEEEVKNRPRCKKGPPVLINEFDDHNHLNDLDFELNGDEDEIDNMDWENEDKHRNPVRSKKLGKKSSMSSNSVNSSKTTHKCKPSTDEPKGSAPAKKKGKVSKGGPLPSKQHVQSIALTCMDTTSAIPEDKDYFSKFGGPALDDNIDEEVEKLTVNQKKKHGLPLVDTNIRVKTVVKPKSLKAKCGGADKWGLHHLPPGTLTLFSEAIVPLLKLDVACGKPWSTVTVKMVKNHVRQIYRDEHVVDAESAYFGLHDIGKHAKAAVSRMIFGFPKGEFPTMEELGEYRMPDREDKGPSDPIYDLLNNDGMANTSEIAKWGGGTNKKGMFMSFLVLYTYVQLLITLDVISATYCPKPQYRFLLESHNLKGELLQQVKDKDKDNYLKCVCDIHGDDVTCVKILIHPIGAFLMSGQAVQNSQAELFSCVVTTFIIDSYKTLNPNSGIQIVVLLSQISHQLANMNNSTPSGHPNLLPCLQRTPVSKSFDARLLAVRSPLQHRCHRSSRLAIRGL
ncbi:unnamed protein product [Mycena citricolor]|uniref:DUF6535 domain-containing protein n=1 Tax=Mycena citricolor TaxID=2018698 RepID=A0AAD2HLD0_9AGAR|nr:unnamed protein product [Mycena citricolor]